MSQRRKYREARLARIKTERDLEVALRATQGIQPVTLDEDGLPLRLKGVVCPDDHPNIRECGADRHEVWEREKERERRQRQLRERERTATVTPRMGALLFPMPKRRVVFYNGMAVERR